jgi:hypothetical protein
VLPLLGAQVHFLHEDDIVTAVQESARVVLAGAGASRTFYTQAMISDVMGGGTAVNPLQ